jgi:phosphohistidine phosphatase SixA
VTLTRLSAFLVLLVHLAAARPAAAQQVIFLVRHAERAETPAQPAAAAAPAPSTAASHGMMMPDDPPLSPAGEQRAARLATMLVRSGIKAIYTTEFRRTRQTAAPLAERLKVAPVMSAARDPGPLVARLAKTQVPALVVGHADTLPGLIKALGVAGPVTIGDNDYDDLFLVIRGAAGKATLVRLKY